MKEYRKYVVFESVKTSHAPMFLNQCVAPAESSTNNLLNDEVIEADGSITIHVGSDVGLLLKEKKFQKLNSFTIDTLVSNLKRDVPSLSNFSDDDIIRTVQSRYVQSAADVKTYERRLRNEIDTLIKDVEHQSKVAKFREKYNKKEPQKE